MPTAILTLAAGASWLTAGGLALYHALDPCLPALPLVNQLIALGGVCGIGAGGWSLVHTLAAFLRNANAH